MKQPRCFGPRIEGGLNVCPYDEGICPMKTVAESSTGISCSRLASYMARQNPNLEQELTNVKIPRERIYSTLRID